MTRIQVGICLAVLIGMHIGPGSAAEPPAANEALLEGVLREEIETVRTALEHGADVDSARTAGGETALTVAAARGYIEIADILLEAGADVNVSNKAGATPLLMACGTNALVSDGGANLVKELLAKGADPTARLNTDRGGWTAVQVMDYSLQELKKPELRKAFEDQYPGVDFAQMEKRRNVLTALLNAGSGSRDPHTAERSLSADEFGRELFAVLKDQDYKSIDRYLWHAEDWAVLEKLGQKASPDRQQKLTERVRKELRDGIANYHERHFKAGSVEYVRFEPGRAKQVSPEYTQHNDSHLVVKINGSEERLEIDHIQVINGVWHISEIR